MDGNKNNIPEKYDETEPKFFPPELWGLSFQFNMFCKLYVTDILQLRPYPMYPGAFAYGNHPVYKVDVLGVVVRVDNKEKLILYSVDDGTGVINCCCWKKTFSIPVDVDKRSSTISNLSFKLQSELSVLEKDKDEGVVIPYRLGELVRVRGKLKQFRNMMDIIASYHHNVKDPNVQASRMMELPHLYRHCYDKTFSPPFCVQQQIMRVGGQNACLPVNHNTTWTLVERIQSFLALTDLEEFSPTDLMKNTGIAELLPESEMNGKSHSILKEAVRRLEEQTGTVCSHKCLSPMFENLTKASSLQKTVNSILQRECMKPKYQEKGCHYLHIHDELRKKTRYSKLHVKAVLHVLNQLESTSTIIRVGDRTYVSL